MSDDEDEAEILRRMKNFDYDKNQKKRKVISELPLIKRKKKKTVVVKATTTPSIVSHYTLNYTLNMKMLLNSFTNEDMGMSFETAMKEVKLTVGDKTYKLMDLMKMSDTLSDYEHYIVSKKPFPSEDLKEHARHVRLAFKTVGIPLNEFSDNLINYALLDSKDERRAEIYHKNVLEIASKSKDVYDRFQKALDKFKKKRGDKDHIEFRAMVTLFDYTKKIRYWTSNSKKKKTKDSMFVLKSYKDILDKYQISKIKKNVCYKKFNDIINQYKKSKQENKNDMNMAYFLYYIVKPINCLLKKDKIKIKDKLDLIELSKCRAIINDSDDILKIKWVDDDERSGKKVLDGFEEYQKVYQHWVISAIASTNKVGMVGLKHYVFKNFNKHLEKWNILELKEGGEYWEKMASEYLVETGKGYVKLIKSLIS